MQFIYRSMLIEHSTALVNCAHFAWDEIKYFEDR